MIRKNTNCTPFICKSDFIESRNGNGHETIRERYSRETRHDRLTQTSARRHQANQFGNV